MSEPDGGFEKTLDELEQIVEALESEQLDLDEALGLFERGIERLRQAAGALDGAHGRVEELIRGVDGRQGLIDLNLEDDETGDAATE